MINGLVDALRSKNGIIYYDNLTIYGLNYARSLRSTLTEIDHKLNHLCHVLMKLEI